MDVTDCGIVTLAKFLQYMNVPSPMDATDEDIFTLAKRLQAANA
jgi:hypothetical protein